MKVKGTDMIGYNQHFQELALLCVRMFPGESDKIERYVVVCPTRFTRRVNHDDNNNQAQQQPPKKQGVAIAYIVGPGERKESPAATNNQRNPTFYKCGNQGHYRSDCLELKNQDHGNQAGGTGAHGMVHALGGGETNQDLNDMEDDINA
ncbi:hypothetical protein Tco_0462075 [Tanacetum coccineum]